MADQSPATEDDIFLSAREAAARLNVSLATLYTYVSRKKLRAVKAGGRSSRYFRSDIERILAASDHQAGRALVSDITTHQAQGMLFRGASAIELSRHATLEEVARHLWTCDTDPFAVAPTQPPEHWHAIFAAAARLPPLDRVSMLLPVIESADLHAHEMSQRGFNRSGANILRWAAAIAVGLPQPSTEPVHLALAAALPNGAGHEELIRRVLALSADNGLEAPVRAVRATASTGATPYRAVIAGLAAATGSRLPSARMGAFGRLMQEIETSDNPREPILSRIREREVLPGFSYTPAAFVDQDPRADELFGYMRDALRDNPQFRRLGIAFDVAVEITGRMPEFSFLCACVARLAGAPVGLSLVRIGRLAGWVAHAMEEYSRHES